VKDTEVLRRWKETVRQITHMEMELGGAYLAARRARPNEIPLLSVRGISDVVGFRRSDEWTQFACDAAASFLKALLSSVPNEAFELPEPIVAPRLADTNEPAPSIEGIVLAFNKSSAPLLSRVVAPEERIPRQELGEVKTHFSCDSGKVLCVLGSPGSGKTALLALLAQEAAGLGIVTLALKADLLPTDSPFSGWGSRELGVNISVSDAVRVIASRRRVLVIVDQLDALSSMVAISSSLFNSVLDFIQRCAKIPNVSVVCSCRHFDYGHDVRFAELNADVVELSLPSWEEIAKQLDRHGITGSKEWPDEYKEILRTPQHLRVYLNRFEATGRSDFIGSYHSMLDELWNRNVCTDIERSLLDSLTEYLMNSESLWAPVAVFERELPTIESLSAKGFLEVQGLQVGFRHQTLLEHAKARLFTKTEQSFGQYVLQHEESLQVRPTVWAVLQYLRDARPDKYRTEIAHLLSAQPRLHLRYLLIEFLGQCHNIDEFERSLLGERLLDMKDRVRVLISIRGNIEWFDALRTSHFPTVMKRDVQLQWPMIGVINAAWESNHVKCFELIRTNWFPNPTNDALTVRVLGAVDKWDLPEVEMACSLIHRSKDHGDRLFWAEHMVYAVSESLPGMAPRLFVEVMNKLDSGDGNEIRASHGRSPIESTQGWYDLPEVAEAAPVDFMRVAWNWFVTTCETHHTGCFSSVLYRYEGYSLSLDEHTHRPESPILSSYLAAIGGTVVTDPSAFVEITRPSWESENAIVHRFIIRGLIDLVAAMPAVVLEYLAGDRRRLWVGADYTQSQSESLKLISALCPYLKAHELRQLESLVLSFTQYRDNQVICESQLEWDREARTRLMAAIPQELRSPEASSYLQKEQAAFPDWNRAVQRARSGFVREIPPICRDEMVDATEEHIVEVICQAPDIPRTGRERTEVEGGWSEPGGPDSAGRELAELAKEYPRKVATVIKGLVARKFENAASGAIQGLSDSTMTDEELFSFARSIFVLNPQSKQLRREIASLVYRRSTKPHGIPDDICAQLSNWLHATASEDQNAADSIDESEGKLDEDGASILWGRSGHLELRAIDYRFWLMIAISEGYLRRNAPAYSEWLSELEKCLEDGLSVQTWANYCVNLGDVRYIDGDKSRGVSVVLKVLDEFPTLLRRQEGILLIANTSDLLPPNELKGMLRSLRAAESPTQRQAYAEVLTLIAFTDGMHTWASESLERELALLHNPDLMDESIAVGIAHAAANLWDRPDARMEAARVLSSLIPIATDKVGHAIATVFWAREDFAVDEFTEQLLQALAKNEGILARIPIVDLTAHLVPIAPFKRELVLKICQGIVNSRPNENELFEVGPQLVKISMTLQRFAETRSGALDLFEQLLRLGLDDAFRVLQVIDIRPTTSPESPHRLRRRRRRRRGEGA
jgi:hypothetical protein